MDVELNAFLDAMEREHGYRPRVTPSGALLHSRDDDRYEGWRLTRHGAGDADRSAELTTAWMAGVERERERAAEDSARLDYIERTFSGMTNRERYLPVTMIWGKGANGRTLREACDKYIAKDAARAGERG